MKPIARTAKSKATAPSPVAALLALIQTSLEDDKAEEIAVIDMAGKSAIADFMVIATGRSQRQVAAMADHLREKIKNAGRRTPPVEGLSQADWVLVDAGDVVIHLFRPDVRAFYNLEKMWSQALPEDGDGLTDLVKEKPVKKSAKGKAKKPVKKATAKPGAKPAARRKPARSSATARRAAG